MTRILFRQSERLSVLQPLEPVSPVPNLRTLPPLPQEEYSGSDSDSEPDVLL